MYEKQYCRKFVRMLSNILEIENYEFKHVKQQPRVLIMMYLILLQLQLMFYISIAAHTMQ